jgi:hypothetical protein
LAYSRLLLYNNALRLCGERRLASLTEDRKPRHLLDQVWSEGGVEFCLEQGQWNFAMRTVRMDYDTATTPAFGYPRAFSKPTDWIRTCGLCSDENFRAPLLDYYDEVDFWYANLDSIYVRYVSSDANWGLNFSLWPKTFSRYVASHFANEIVFDMTSDKERIGLVEQLAVRRKRDALNKDAMNEPTRFPAPGSWVRARAGSMGGRRDGGNRGSLIG